MAPTAATSLFSSANLVNDSAVVSTTPSSTPFIQFAISEHSQTTSPKQFIPVGILAAFLILMFFSHVMRYPRLLYVSHELLGNHPRSVPDDPYASQQGHRSLREEKHNSRANYFPRTSFSESKRLSSFDPHTEAIYSEPTVRLVRAYHAHSPEPRVHLPEEITLPSPSSQTLVNSSRSDISLSNLDIQNLPARVYLPPVLPDTFELSIPQRRADVFYNDSDASPPLSDFVWKPSSNQIPPGLSTSRLTRSFAGFFDLTTSSDVLAVSFQDQRQTSTPSSKLFTGSFEGSRLMCSPELSPPPLAHAHPILVRRALFPWRRRSPLEPSFDTFMHIDLDHTGVSAHCHRPSVPSRLRYFITRSITTSFSGSQTHSTPASSSGKRSEKSLIGSRPSSTHDGTVRPHHAKEETGARFSEDLLSASARMSELAISSATPRQSSISDNKSLAQANQVPPQCRLFDKFKRLSVPENMWRNLKTSSAKDENVAKVARDRHRRESLPCPDVHRVTTEYSNSVGLGLRLVSSEPIEFDAHRILSLPVASHAQGDEDFGVDAQYLQAGGSLRTVPSRWMNSESSPISSDASAVVQGRGLSNIQHDMLADESVEVMVISRSEGLDGIVG